MKKLLSVWDSEGNKTFINIDAIRFISASVGGTLICVGTEDYIEVDAPIEEVMNAIAEAMKESEGE